MESVFDPPKSLNLAVAGTDAPSTERHIRRVGRSHAAHACEMGRNPLREVPFLFHEASRRPAAVRLEAPPPRQGAGGEFRDRGGIFR